MPRLQVHVEMLAEDGVPTASRDNAGVRVSVRFSWLAQVWGRGAAVLLRRLVLDVEKANENRITLVAVAPDFGEPGPITITLR